MFHDTEAEQVNCYVSGNASLSGCRMLLINNAEYMVFKKTKLFPCRNIQWVIVGQGHICLLLFFTDQKLRFHCFYFEASGPVIKNP